MSDASVSREECEAYLGDAVGAKHEIDVFLKRLARSHLELLDSNQRLHDLVRYKRSELLELREWKDSVNGCLAAVIQQHPTLDHEWGGVRTGWGFVLEWIRWVGSRAVVAESQNDELRSQIQQLRSVANKLAEALKEFVPRMEVMFTRGDFDRRDERITRKLVTKAKAALAQYAEMKSDKLASSNDPGSDTGASQGGRE